MLRAEAAQRLQELVKKQLAQRPPAEVEAAEAYHRVRNKWLTYFPDKGPLRRELYVPHTTFMRDGALHSERAFIAANRIGKNEAAAYEIRAHTTGVYPAWWEGRRFKEPTRWWVANRTWKEVRDVNQTQLLGPPDQPGQLGTGMIPFHAIEKITNNPHIKHGVESMQVRHLRGISTIQFKAYEQGWQAFEGEKRDGIWLDEQCPQDIYAACLLRITSTTGRADSKDGLIMLTFTPLEGMTELILCLRENAVNKDSLPW